MSSVLNRTTLAYYPSANTPDYDPSIWIINPDLSAVQGQPSIYWVINADDTVSLLPQDQWAQRALMAPYDGLSLSDAISSKVTQVNAYRDAFLVNGWQFNGVRYDSDATSVQNIAGTMTMINAGYTLPSDFTWRAHDNSNNPFSNQTFPSFFIAASTWREAAYRVSWAHKANVGALTSIQAVASYDHTTGWIKGYTFSDSGMSPVY